MNPALIPAMAAESVSWFRYQRSGLSAVIATGSTVPPSGGFPRT